jgi:hypothetical protein
MRSSRYGQVPAHPFETFSYVSSYTYRRYTTIYPVTEKKQTFNLTAIYTAAVLFVLLPFATTTNTTQSTHTHMLLQLSFFSVRESMDRVHFHLMATLKYIHFVCPALLCGNGGKGQLTRV